MQADINGLSGPLGVVGIEIQERIKGRSWVGIQKCFPQSRLAGFARGHVLPFIPGITKTQLPVPRLEIMAKFPHLATQSHVEQRIPVGELFMSGTGVVNSAKGNPGSHRDRRSVNNQSRVSNREGIKRIRDWHTYAVGTKAYVSAWNLEWIGHKRHSCQRRVKKRTDIFKIAKHLQIFVTQIAREGTVEGLAISRRKRGRYSREVIEEVVATPLILNRAGLWHPCNEIYTGGPRICIGSDYKGVL